MKTTGTETPSALSPARPSRREAPSFFGSYSAGSCAAGLAPVDPSLLAPPPPRPVLFPTHTPLDGREDSFSFTGTIR